MDLFKFNDQKKEREQKNRVLDLIAPAGLKINSKHIQLGEKYARTFFVFDFPGKLATGWLSPLITLDQEMNISIAIYPTETKEILKDLRKKTAQVQSQISMEMEKGKVRDPKLEAALDNIEAIRDRLQTGEEKLFKFGLYLTIFAENEKSLDEAENKIRSILETQMVYAKPAVFQQEQGFNSTLPLGLDQLAVHNTFNTSSLATAFPFISSDLTDNKGVLYGVNRHNNSLILFDRFSMENANMVIFAKSGAGKSYFTKLEVLRSLMQDTEVIIIDPENEYQYLAETVDGAFVDISLASNNHINPFDLPKLGQGESKQDVLKGNIVNLVGLLRMMMGGLSPEEDALLDKALIETYAFRDIDPDSNFENATPPLMQDLQSILKGMVGAEKLVTRLEKYITGSYANFFNQYTNVILDKKLVVFSIRDMEDELRPLAMYIILRYIWNIIRSKTKRRLMVVDEAWWMMQHEDAASFMFGIAKRCRKYYLGLTTITQDVQDFMRSKYGAPIVTNSSLQILFKQSPAAIDLVQKTFQLTEQEKYMLLQCAVGEGIIFAGNKHAAIQVVASYAEDQIITSDPAQILEIEKAKQDLADQEAGENSQKEKDSDEIAGNIY